MNIIYFNPEITYKVDLVCLKIDEDSWELEDVVKSIVYESLFNEVRFWQRLQDL